MTETAQHRPGAGIAFIMAGMLAISLNDMLVKQLSGAYPLHQIVFIRSAVGIVLSLGLVWVEGGLRILKTRHPFLHALRGLLVVISNMSFFAALAVAPLADVTALFFAAPLFITLLSVPILKERVGPMRLGAVLVGFSGVILMQRPWQGAESLEASRLVLLLPVLSALTYALLQLMTRKLGVSSKASALSVYIQLMFILVGALFYLVAGDGRFVDDSSDPSLIFLLRAWTWPSGQDWLFLTGLGLNSAIIGYCLAQAYRQADAATVAPFEYVGLPLAVFWGWMIWGDLPDWEVWAGMALIAGSGLFVFLREQRQRRTGVRSGSRAGRV
ncbi:DMT family transporter [Ruegeria pomeroyi]|uniref:DMT family transporter n=1 Tax=Ruegeria pomeroyi TaxID=89184 RepID=UPI001F456E6E|nr:DMT family transporter [Ruegeria pomeroyi]MCE8508709.1 DMT family transporter [Ruegeria pomeroyi]